jgi:putative transposase
MSLGPGSSKRVRPRLIQLKSHTTCSRRRRSGERDLRSESADAERLFLRAPEEGKIDPAGETDHGEVGRLAASSRNLILWSAVLLRRQQAQLAEQVVARSKCDGASPDPVPFRGITSDPKPENYDSDKLRNWRLVWSSAREEGGLGCRSEDTSRSRFCGAAPGRRGHEGPDLCRELGISEATYYVWKKKYAGLGLSELRELRQLRDENAKLKRLVADLSLDRHMLQEIVRKSCKASAPARVGALDASRLCGERA